MSVDFLRTFFPSANAALEQYAPAALDRAFPQWVRQRCPGPAYALALPGGVPLRHISLLPLQLAGAAVGGAALTRTAGFLRWGFAAFAAMNLASVFAHDFGDTGTRAWRLAATADVVCTAVANACVVLAARAQADGRKWDGRGPAGAAVAAAIAAAAAVAGFAYGHVPFVHEVLYVGTAGAAAAYCLPVLARARRDRPRCPCCLTVARCFTVSAVPGSARCLTLDGSSTSIPPLSGRPPHRLSSLRAAERAAWAGARLVRTGAPRCSQRGPPRAQVRRRYAASSRAQRRWLLAACAGAAVMAGAVWADRTLCLLFGNHVNMVHLLFLGCDVVFFAFLQLYAAPAGPARAAQSAKQA